MSMARKNFSVPIVFEPNRGQFDSRAQFVARSAGYALLFGSDELKFVGRSSNEGMRGRLTARRGVATQLAMRFGDGNRRLVWRGQEQLAAHANYFLGRDPRGWRTDGALFSSVRAREIAPGVDCVAYGGESGLEFDLIVAPQADLHGLHFDFKGAKTVALEGNGDLVLRQDGMAVRLRNPEIYQLRNGQRIPIDGRYALGAHHRILFRLAAYDRSQALLIDPAISVSYTTFLGGTGSDSASSVTVDSTGKAYLSGTASAAGFPEITANSIGPGGSASDFFVAKLDPTLTGASSLLFLTFIGGSGAEQGGESAVNTSGNVALSGSTTSTDYPTTDSTALGTNTNALALTVLNPAGNSLLFSTLLVGNGSEATQAPPAVAFAPNGNILVASDTTSTNLPVTAGAYQEIFGSGGDPATDTISNDGLLGVYSPSGTLAYLTYLGIDGYAYTDTSGDSAFAPVQVGVTGLAVDLLGQAYIAGFTSQPGTGFPTTNGFQTTYGGGAFDGFLMNINARGLSTSDLIYSTFLGGGGSDQAFAVGVDGAIPANAYVAGTTKSSSIFATPVNAGFQTTLKGTANAFLAVVSQTQAGVTSLEYATYLGGEENDSALSVKALGANAVYLAGHTTSPGFPTLNTLQAFSGASDAFLAKLDTTQAGTPSLLYSTLLGGRNDAQANSVAATATGNVFVAGSTTSPDFPLAGNPQTGVQPVCTSCGDSPPLSDAFLTELTEGASSGPVVSFNANEINFGNQLDGMPNPPSFVILTNSGTAALVIAGISMVGPNAGDFSQSGECPISPQTLAVGSNCSITVTFSPTAAGAESAALSFTDNATGSPQSVDLVGTGEEPLASPSAPALAFGNQPTGTTSAQQMLTLTNGGNLALDISLLAIGGSGASEFAFKGVDTCTNPPKVPPGGSCSIGIAFEPQTTGPFNAQLQFTDNAGNESGAMQLIPLSGTGVPPSPAVSLSPASLTFAAQITGTTSGPLPVTLTNTGSLALQISTISLTGTNAAEFAFASGTNCPLSGGTLNASAACTISIAFTPATTGPAAAAITFSDNVTGSPQIVPLNGTGSSASLTLSPSSLAFSAEPLQVASAAQTVTVSNPGSTAIQISNIAMGGANPADFMQTNNCPGTLNAGVTCEVNVAFNPVAGGNLTATVSISDNAAGSPQSVILSGTGLVPAISLSTTSLSFTAQPILVGTASAATAIGLTNTGTGGLVISSLAFSGPNPGDFTATQNCGKMLLPNASCNMSVTFEPTAAGTRAATLSINDNVPGSPQTIALSGDASDFSLGPPAGDPESVVVTAGATANFNMQLNPLDGFTGTVGLACTGAPSEATCSVTPASLNATGTAAVPFAVSVTTQTAASWIPLGGSQSRRGPRPRTNGMAVFAALLLIALLSTSWVASALNRYRRISVIPALACWLLIAIALVSCGSAGDGSSAAYQPGTPQGTYTLTITGSVPASGAGATQNVTRTVQLTLAVQ
ncbi:MAG: choice-of-anchor D domain-containing protein [Candidatus Acidiferrales bacterium]